MKKSMVVCVFCISFFSMHSYAYECDKREYCSEMTSCEEARWVSENCPASKMDGDRDGFPCEDWCGHNNIKSANPVSDYFDNQRVADIFAMLQKQEL